MTIENKREALKRMDSNGGAREIARSRTSFWSPARDLAHIAVIAALGMLGIGLISHIAGCVDNSYRQSRSERIDGAERDYNPKERLPARTINGGKAIRSIGVEYEKAEPVREKRVVPIEEKTKKRNVSVAGIDLIKQFEGYRGEAYRCQAGVWTVGYGHTKGVGRWTRINPEQAEQYLGEDLKNAEGAVTSYVRVPLNQCQYDALVSLTYNIGSGKFRDSTTLKNLNSGNYACAREAIRLWNKAGGKVSKGLMGRREAEYKMFGGRS